MSANKTQPTKKDVLAFLNQVEESRKRTDAIRIMNILKEITNKPPVMWGDSIIGFDQYHYKYKSGREGDFLRIGFSPRKRNLTLYLMDGVDNHVDELKTLGKHSTGKSCLYIKSLADVDTEKLHQILKKSYRHTFEIYPASN